MAERGWPSVQIAQVDENGCLVAERVPESACISSDLLIPRSDGIFVEKRRQRLLLAKANRGWKYGNWLQPGLVYYYRVFALNQAGSSAASPVDDARPIEFAVWFHDDFNGGANPMWSSIVGGALLDGGAGFRGSPALWFGAGSMRSATTAAINATRGGLIEFLFRAGNTARDGAEFWDDSEAGENVVLEYLLPGGTWMTLAALTTAAPAYNDWTPMVFEIPAAAVSEATRFRWRQLVHSGMGADTWALEDVRIRAEAPALPEAPAVLIGAASGSTSASLLWSPSRGALGYIVQQLVGGMWLPVASTGSEATFSSITGLEPETVYHFRVLATNVAGASAPSPLAFVVTFGGSLDPAVGGVTFGSHTVQTMETPEGGSTVLTVHRTGFTDAPASVEYVVAGESATAGEDFVAEGGIVVFAPGQATATITVPLLPDRLTEEPETFSVRLQNPSGTSLGAITSTTVTIFDDDHVGAFTFADATTVVSEGSGSATVVVRRVGGSVGEGTVEYSVTGGSAQPADYSLPAGALVFADGETEKTIEFEVIDDEAAEGGETVVLTLTAASGGASLGGVTQHTVTISDDDGGLEFIKASYAALLAPQGSTIAKGLVQFRTTRKGEVSGTLMIGRTRQAFTGKFDETGQAQVRFAGSLNAARNRVAAGSALVLTMNWDRTEFTVAHQNGAGALMTGEGARLVSASDAAPGLLKQTLTGVMVNTGSEEVVHGLTSIVITKTAGVKLRGYAPDLRPLSGKVRLTIDGRLLIGAVLPGGTLYGSLSTEEGGDGVLSGSLWWREKSRQQSVAAEPMNLTLVLSRYVATPAPGAPFKIGAPGSQLVLLSLVAEAEGSGMNARWEKSALVANDSGNSRARLTVNRMTGLITGSWLEPKTPPARMFGVIVQVPDGEDPLVIGFGSSGTPAAQWTVTSPAPSPLDQ